MAKKNEDEAPTLLQVSGHEVRITHPSKVYFAARGETKLDLVRYYMAVDERIMRTTMGCLGFHVWPSHADDIEHPDELRIDLDPSRS